jgi:hypothetical protein
LRRVSSRRFAVGFASTRRLAARLILVGAFAGILGSCAASPTPAAGACVDARAPGANPSLENLLPSRLADAPPTTVDSGANCSADALTTLRAHGVTELDFAGATWDAGNGVATSVAVLALPAAAPLPVAWVEEFYEVGARSGKKTDNVSVSRPAIPSVGAVYRLDALNDLSFQSVVVWPDGPVVRVVIVASPVNPSASRAEHDSRVEAAVQAAALAPDG